MTHKVFKYILKVEDEQEIWLPEGAKILKIDAQREEPCLWALVDITKAHVSRLILMRGTGHSLVHDPKSCTYLGTFFLYDSALVFHVFEYGEPN